MRNLVKFAVGFVWAVVLGFGLPNLPKVGNNAPNFPTMTGPSSRTSSIEETDALFTSLHLTQANVVASSAGDPNLSRIQCAIGSVTTPVLYAAAMSIHGDIGAYFGAVATTSTGVYYWAYLPVQNCIFYSMNSTGGGPAVPPFPMNEVLWEENGSQG